jgi:Flp pilus assembly protein TadG
MMHRFKSIKSGRAYVRSEDGVSAVEFAIWTAVLAPMLVSVIDLGIYAYDKVQVANASQSAVQAGWAYWNANCTSLATTTACDTANSSGFSTAVKRAIPQASALRVTAPASVVPGSSEGSYCANTSGKLVTTGCPTGWVKGYYYALTVTYTYHALFGSASVASLLPATISQTSWTRLK